MSHELLEVTLRDVVVGFVHEHGADREEDGPPGAVEFEPVAMTTGVGR